MAKTTKATDASDAALSAVEEALRIDFPDEVETADETRAPEAEAKDAPKPAAPAPAAERTARPAEAATGRRPANDDRHAVGALLRGLQRRPSSSPFWVALAASALWVVGGLALAGTVFARPLGELLSADALAATPGLIAYLVAVALPVFFFFTLAYMVWRAAEMRLVARSMTEVALRLAEPEDIAKERVLSLGQAIRREVAAMGDGVERALARANELEVMVHNEVATLERTYAENESRVRSIVERLGGERQQLISSAEQLSGAISNTHQNLSAELESATSRIADTLQTSGTTITRTLGEKAEAITLALASAGTNLSETLGGRGQALIDQLATTGNDVTDRLTLVGNEIAENLGARVQGVDETLRARAEEITGSVTETVGVLGARIEDQGRIVTDTLTLKATEISDQLSGTGEAIVNQIAQHGTQVNEELDLTGRRVAETFITRTDEVTGSLRTAVDSLLVDLEVRSSEITGR
ncbi:MAG: antitoxin, partial [Hyphomicrobiaceae bacterium]|nr:antitoxin [Hyphomicrobiaceae bacterium]